MKTPTFSWLPSLRHTSRRVMAKCDDSSTYAVPFIAMQNGYLAVPMEDGSCMSQRSESCGCAREIAALGMGRGVPFDVSIVISSGRHPESIGAKVGDGNPPHIARYIVGAVPSAPRLLFHASAAFLGAGPCVCITPTELQLAM